MNRRVHNFNPGPAALPRKVLEQVRDEFLNYDGTGMSVVETSHRSRAFDDIINDTICRVKRLAGLSDEYAVLLMQGGASLQFALVPMNLCGKRVPAYVNTGTWSTKAIEEARIQGVRPITVASSEDGNFTYIPEGFQVPNDAAYLHVTSNNTISGTQWNTLPDSAVPLMVDMSSDIFSRPLEFSSCGLIYAGAQKNLGPAGVTMVIIRRDLLERTPQNLPTMLRYTTYAASNSLYNTPPSFSIYMVGLVLKWIEEDMGGLEKIGIYNRQKARILYDFIDQSAGFYQPTAEKDSRSLMNVTFRLADEHLGAEFLAKANESGMCGLKGHKSVGGFRASIYNAVTQEAVKDLVAFMDDFIEHHG